MPNAIQSRSNNKNESEIDEENDLFYFESDHLALRGNKDYSELLKTIATLEAQRSGAIQDIDKLIEIQNVALKDPAAFLQKLKNNEDLGIPVAHKIPEIPKIDWAKYEVPIPEELLKLIDQEKSTENNSKIPEIETKKTKHIDNSTTFKKPWTSEEQKKLEELLITFPPEPIEMRRYKKIAEALGNRTVQQVSSRVQKYFLKLYKAGLPVPGRIPKAADKKRSFTHKHQRNNFYLFKPSTFFPDMEVPVFMSENDDDLPITSVPETSSSNLNREVKDELQLKIELLKRIKMEKEKEKKMPAISHEGFKCDICNENPIIGSRWHCCDCNQFSIDFCTDCMISQLNTPNCHPLTHHIIPLQNSTDPQNLSTMPSTSNLKMEPLSENESDSSDNSDSSEEQIMSSDTAQSMDSAGNKVLHSIYDKDYVSDAFMNSTGKYNYLDPNFLPQ